MIPALKPCPFCGADLVLIEAFSNRLKFAFVHPMEEECILSGAFVDVPKFPHDADRPEYRRAKLWQQRL